MTNKEEIKKLAANLANPNVCKTTNWIEGYTQCQQDMADKKYTEDDIRKAIQVGISAEAGDYPEGFTYKLGISLEDYFINSLNKQD